MGTEFKGTEFQLEKMHGKLLVNGDDGHTTV